MMLTVEEYMFLRSMMGAPAGMAEVSNPEVPVKTNVTNARRRRKSRYAKAMSKELKELNARYKTKKGVYRKGYDAARIMKMAHKNVRRSMK